MVRKLCARKKGVNRFRYKINVSCQEMIQNCPSSRLLEHFSSFITEINDHALYGPYKLRYEGTDKTSKSRESKCVAPKPSLKIESVNKAFLF